MPSKHPDTQSVVQAVRQALYHISRTNPIPESNRLLYSPLVEEALKEHNLNGALENRRAMLEELLCDLVNVYGISCPKGQRQQQRHRHIFRVLFLLLRGEPHKLDYPARSYERYHAAGVRILAEMIAKREETLALDANEEVETARRQAQTIREWFVEHPNKIDFFALATWQEATRILADHDRWQEARTHFDDALAVLNQAPNNQAVIEFKAHLAEGLAHAEMNVGDPQRALQLYQWTAEMARHVGIDALWLEAVHAQGTILTILNRFREATERLETATIYVGLDHRYPLHRHGRVLRDLLAANLFRWEAGRIEKVAREALSSWQKADNAQGMLVTLEIWARALVVRRRFTEARRLLEKATSLLPLSRSPIHHTSLRITQVELLLAEGDETMAYDIASHVREKCLQHGLVNQLHRLNQATANQVSAGKASGLKV